MGLSGGTGVGGGIQPPQIEESKAQAFVEVMKKNVLAMLPPDTLEVIPFTQREYDEVFKYKTESDRPLLHPLLFMRMTDIEEAAEEENWQSVYDELLESMPDSVKEWLAWEMDKPFADRDPSYVAFDQLMTIAAKTVVWLSVATQPMEPNSSEEAFYLLNLTMPYVSLRGSIDHAQTALNDTQSWLDSVGPNDPNYDVVTNLVGRTNSALTELNALRQEIEGGNDSPEIKQRLTEVAYEMNKVKALFNKNPELQILGTSLETLSVVSASWALTSGSPTLLQSTSLVTTGLSDIGSIGASYNKAVDAILNGIVGSIDSGPRAELSELTNLYNALAELKER